MVMTRSIFPLWQSRTIFKKSLRFLAEVPVIPSSAYRRTMVQSGLELILSV